MALLNHILTLNAFKDYCYTVFFFWFFFVVCLTFSRYPHTDFPGHGGSHDHTTGAGGDSQ